MDRSPSQGRGQNRGPDLAATKPTPAGSSLRVVHINTERTWRGGEQQTLYLARGLVCRGHATTLVAPPGSPLVERARAAGIPCFPLAMRGEVDPVAITRLTALLRRLSPDIVQMHTSHAHSLGALASVLARRGRRIVSRRVDFSIHRHRLSLSGLKYRWGIDRYIAISHAIKHALISDGVPDHRIDVVRSGIDPERLRGADPTRPREQWHLAAGEQVVGTVAHFGWHKGLEYLVRAAPYIARAGHPVKIVLVGDGKLRPQLEAERRRCGVQDVVHLAGFRPDVADCLAAMDVFVMPSVMEGLCTSILDALALGRPVVASRVGGIPEIIRDRETGLLVPARNPEELARAIVTLLENPDLARRLAEEGRRLVGKSFSVEAMVEGNIAVYRDVLARARGRGRKAPGRAPDRGAASL